MLKISPLFSGSKGNCTLIQSPQTNLLLDVGFTYRHVVNALAERGLEPKDITAIVITHEHIDHIGALSTWTRHTPTPIYAPSRIAHLIEQRTCCSDVSGIVGDFTVGDIGVEHYECSHDAVCCFGYKFTCGASRFACVTDTGCIDEELIDFLQDCKGVMLESNHDVDMLKNGVYTYTLKQRILSPFGHLSNAQTAEILKRIAHSEVKTVVLAHLSEQNNNKEIAFNTAVQAYSFCGMTVGKDVTVYVADQRKNDITVDIE